MNNRFLQFLINKRNILSKAKSFFALLGITVMVLVFIEVFFINFPGDKLTAEERFLTDYRHHPYLDFTVKHRESRNICKKEEEGPLRIDIYGGSTMWGLGVDNHETIPSFYEDILCKEGLNVEVRNMGQFSYNNSQEVINFFLELKKGNIPDIVIFYDGANEFYARIPGYPSEFKTMEVFMYYIQNRGSGNYFPNTVRWIRGRMASLGLKERYQAIDNLNIKYFDYPHEDVSYEKILDVYLQNIKTVKKMEEIFGFKSFFYWQPNLTTKKTLSASERAAMENKAYSWIVDIYLESDETVSRFLEGTDKVTDIRSIFDDFKDTIFLDDCHKYPKGNRVIAERMVKDTLNYLKNK